MSAVLTKLIEFTSFDQEVFRQIILDSGWQSAACYHVKEGSLIQLIESNTADWPVSVSLNLNYTPDSPKFPLGWSKKNQICGDSKAWSKDTVFYFPEQFLSSNKIVFAILQKSNRKIEEGNLDGLLEALYRRILSFVESDVVRHDISQIQIAEQFRQANINIANVISHELRSPLCTIRGFAALLGEPTELSDSEPEEFAALIEADVDNIMTAIEKLTSVFSDPKEKLNSESLEELDIEELCQNIVYEKNESNKVAGANGNGSEARIEVKSSLDSPPYVDCVRSRMTNAIEEILSNGINYCSQGKIRLELSKVQDSLLIDVYDQGEGVAEGTEELIFMNFFRDPSVKLGKFGRRGLGIGLGLARSIVEQHGGQLKFVRLKGRKGFFRIQIPVKGSFKKDQFVLKGA